MRMMAILGGADDVHIYVCMLNTRKLYLKVRKNMKIRGKKVLSMILVAVLLVSMVSFSARMVTDDIGYAEEVAYKQDIMYTQDIVLYEEMPTVEVEEMMPLEEPKINELAAEAIQTSELITTEAQLRAAIASAAAGGDNVIELGANAVIPIGSVIAVSAAGASEGQIIITGSAEAPAVIEATHAGRIFNVGNGHLILGDTAGGSVIIDGNGIGSGINVSGTGRLTLRGNAVIRNGVAADGGGINVAGGGVVVMEGGTITNNSATQQGGGIRFSGVTTFNMTGGNITGNSASRGGGGVRLAVGSTFNMSGNAVIGNNETTGTGEDTSGAGVLIAGAGYVNMSGNAIIENNMALGHSADGGGIHFNGSGHLTMADNSIIRGNVGRQGGGARMRTGSSVTMRDNSAIYGNQAHRLAGGGLFAADNSVFNMSDDSVIHSNQALGGGGGGIFIAGTGGHITMTENASIRHNTAGHGGGAMHFIYSGTVIMRDNASIRNNESLANGGGFHFYRDAVLRMYDSSSISDNTSNTEGAGVRMRTDSAITMQDQATIAHNHSRNNRGGGIFLIGSLTMLDQSSIVNNTAFGDGGGVYTNDYSLLYIADTVLFANNVSSNGAFLGPVDRWTAFPNIRWLGTNSLGGTVSGQRDPHLLNNFDVNARGESLNLGSYIRFHTDGQGVIQTITVNGGETQIVGHYYDVPVTFSDGRAWIVESSPEWQAVLGIGNMYASQYPNEMRIITTPVERIDVGWTGGTRVAAAFWGWFEQESLGPREAGIAGGGEQPTRWRPALGNNMIQVYPGSAMTGDRPLYAPGEALGLDLNHMRTHGLDAGLFESGPVDFFGIWIRWGDIDDNGGVFSDDSAFLDRYLEVLNFNLSVGLLLNIEMPFDRPIHHGAGVVTLGAQVNSDDSERIDRFLEDVNNLYAFGFHIQPPTRLGAEQARAS